MELRVLHYFLTVAQEENFTRAAAKLHVTQPTLSRQLKEMEEEYGTQLMIRGPRRIKLTEEGILLKRRAEEILSLVEQTEKELLEDSETITGDVRIGAGESIYFQKVLAVVKEVRQKYPGIQVHVVTGDVATITYMLNRGLLDFGFVYGDLAPEEYQWIELPYADRWGVLMRREAELAKKEFIHAEDLWDKPLIISRQVLSRSTHGYSLKDWLQKPIEELKFVGSFTMLYNGSLMVKEGLGYALSFDGIINTEGTELCYRPLSPAVESIPNFVWKRQQVFSKAAQKFLDYFKKHYAN